MRTLGRRYTKLAAPVALPLAVFDGIRHAGLTRDHHVGLFEATYIDLSKLERGRELCISCAGAVLDAAFKDQQP